MGKCIIFLAIFCLIAFPSITNGEIQSKLTQLTTRETQLVEWVHSQQAAMLKKLETYVNINTGTRNQEGLNQFRDLLEIELQSLGFETSARPGGEMELLSCRGNTMVFADHLLASRTGKKHAKVLLNGHLDTVFAKEDEFQSMIMETDGTLKGPGVLDMKGGLVALTYALQALHYHGHLVDTNITIFLNTDEEVGSL